MELAIGMLGFTSALATLAVAILNLLEWRARRLRPVEVSSERRPSRRTAQPEPPMKQTAAARPNHRRPIDWLVRGSLRLALLLVLVASVGFGGGGLLFVHALSGEGPRVLITSPSDGDVVPRAIRVEVEARLESPDEFLTILVQPLPGDPYQYYWIQEFPQAVGGKRWEASPVYVGQPEDKPGTPFKICAVLLWSRLSPGEAVPALPAGRSACVLVTRQ